MGGGTITDGKEADKILSILYSRKGEFQEEGKVKQKRRQKRGIRCVKKTAPKQRCSPWLTRQQIEYHRLSTPTPKTEILIFPSKLNASMIQIFYR